jgi:hypothetical protein
VGETPSYNAYKRIGGATPPMSKRGVFMRVTYNDLVQKFGLDIVKHLTQKQVEEYILQAENNIIDFIANNSVSAFDIATVSTFEGGIINECILIQAKYIVANGGDLSEMSGFDPVSNQFQSIEEIQKRIVAPVAQQKLRKLSYFYRGVL